MADKKHPRVVLFSPLPPPYGGIARWTQTMLDTPADELGVRVSVVNTAHKHQRSDETPTATRLLSGATQLARSLAQFLGLFARQGRPTCIHVNSSGSFGLIRDIIVLVTARVLRTRSVLHLRFGRTPHLLSRTNAESTLLRCALRLATVTVSIDPTTHAAVTREIGPERARHIPNFIHTEKYPEASTVREPHVLFLGSVSVSKGVEELIEAWDTMRPDGWTLDLVGPVAPHFEGHANGHHPGRGIVFHGALEHDKAMELMARSALFVLPSHSEGFPNVLLEAMVSGTPVIATDVGAIPQMLAGGAGRVVSAKDVGGLAAALSELATNESARWAMSDRASRRVREEYSSEVVFSAYRSVWLDQ